MSRPSVSFKYSRWYSSFQFLLIMRSSSRFYTPAPNQEPKQLAQNVVRNVLASPLQAKIDKSPRQVQQLKKTTVPRHSTTSFNKTVPGNNAHNVLQAKFQLTQGEKKTPYTAEEVKQWCATKGAALNDVQKRMIDILADCGEMVELHELDDPNKITEYLKKRDKDFRPAVMSYKEGQNPRRRCIPGELSREMPGTLHGWKSVAPTTQLGIPSDLDRTQTTEFAHVTAEASAFNYVKVDPCYGANPGEFGTAFTRLQGMIRKM
jgi:hypothetical protein